ncbi:hypothetical protein [Desulfofarcimen acetoxidans]|nr:hypothetical protein [Desulfofarcimen acetoxidans]
MTFLDEQRIQNNLLEKEFDKIKVEEKKELDEYRKRKMGKKFF